MIRTHATQDGAALLVRTWSPDVDPWTHLLLVHGVAEHSGRYERTGRRLAQAGIHVTAFDLRGHGGSSGRRGDVERWTDLTNDLGALLAEVRATAGDGPVVLMGHSMGGLLCLDAVLAGDATPDLLVLSAPGLGDGLPRWQHLLAPIGARWAPTLTAPNAWTPAALSRDPEVGRAVAADALCLTRTTFRLGALAFAAQDRVRGALPGLRIPTLVLHGDADPLVPVTATDALGRLPGVTREVQPRLRHELLNEPEGPAVVDRIVAWLRLQVPSR